MTLTHLNILNFKNIAEADLAFADNINCFVGLNGQGKTNLLDAIYYLSFTKSAFSALDSQNIMHSAPFAMIQGTYDGGDEQDPTLSQFSLSLKRGVKKSFRRGKKDYQRLQDHIGLIPLVMVSPADHELILDGSDARRKFMDGVICQYSRPYLDALTRYNALLKQRNALLKQYEEAPAAELPIDLFEVVEQQMARECAIIYKERTEFVEHFVPSFREMYAYIAGEGGEEVELVYRSQLQDRDILEAFSRTRSRDLILGWTSQGIHKDELEMLLCSDGERYPLKTVASQGQQKTYLLAMKLAQAIYLGKPILLLDDIFDRLDSRRMERILQLVCSDRFGQIFITDTDRQHISDLLTHTPDARLFRVSNGQIQAEAQKK